MPALNDHELSRVLAARAGELLLRLRTENPTLSPKELGAAGDRAAHAMLMEALAEHRPDDAVLSEEGVDNTDRLAASRVWIIDPLDGTREYGENRADWAVHVCLAVDGKAEIGAIALPARDLVLATDAPPALPAPVDRKLRVAVSRSRPPAFVNDLPAELVPMGSAGAKTAAVILGEVDAYVHAGGQYEWDSAAPVAVARAAGAHTSRVDGSALVYNQPHPYLPDLLVCRPEHRDVLVRNSGA
jgi:3'(2'), 5'-bisphosphate nucleotidase